MLALSAPRQAAQPKALTDGSATVPQHATGVSEELEAKTSEIGREAEAWPVVPVPDVADKKQSLMPMAVSFSMPDMKLPSFSKPVPPAVVRKDALSVAAKAKVAPQSGRHGTDQTEEVTDIVELCVGDDEKGEQLHSGADQ